MSQIERKYEFTDDTILACGGKTLHRIKALRAFGNVEKGELGGYIETESNLSHEGDCWVYGNAWVCDNAQVYGNAQVKSQADWCTFTGFGRKCRTTTAFKRGQ